MATGTRKTSPTRFRMIRQAVVVIAALALLLTTQVGALASEAEPVHQESRVVMLNSIPEDMTSGASTGTTAAKPGVSVWGKCQVPGKCEVGASIKIRF